MSELTGKLARLSCLLECRGYLIHFRMFLKVMQWSNYCIPWQIDLVGVLFGLRPLLCVWFGFLSGLLFSLTKRKSGWGICGSSWFGGLVCFLVVLL